MSQRKHQSSTQLPHEVVCICTALYLEMDTDKNGWLSREELKEGFQRTGIRFDDNQAEKAFRDLDKNIDGKITLDEFLAVLCFIQETDPKECRRADFRRAFKDFDKDGDGYLSEKELGELLKQAGCGDLTKEQIAKITANVDRDGDGKINFEEFVLMFED